MNNYRNSYSNTPYSQAPACTPINTGYPTRSTPRPVRGRTAGADSNPFDPADRSAEVDDSIAWNGVIHDSSTRYVLLDEGNYSFTVTAVEQGRFPGNQKSRPCGKAMVTMVVDTPEGPAYARRDFFLREKYQWQLADFFRCLGLMGRGEDFEMDWEAAIGRVGRAHFRPEQYTNAYGETRDKNTVTAFYDPDDRRHCAVGE